MRNNGMAAFATKIVVLLVVGLVAHAQSQRVEAWEKRINEERQPPEKVMDAIGLKPGMIVGEIGAGRGRDLFCVISER